jgi:hypothetical protein
MLCLSVMRSMMTHLTVVLTMGREGTGATQKGFSKASKASLIGAQTNHHDESIHLSVPFV